MRATDFYEIDGIPIISINADTDDKRLKTAAAVRKIPLHTDLIDLGCLEFALASSKSGEERLFAELPKTRDGYGSKISKWFNRTVREKLGFDDKKSFHSFRHTFINSLKQLGVDETTIAELAGHSVSSVTMGRYGKPFEPARLKAAVDKLKFPLICEELRR